MKKKLFSLLTLLLIGISGGWGQTTLFNMEISTSVGDIRLDAGATVDLNTTTHLSALSGGSITLKNGSSSNNQKLIGSENSERHIRLTNDAHCAIITLSNNTLAQGDIISFTGNANVEISITKTNTRATTIQTSSKAYTIPAASPLIGESTIYIWKGGGNTYIKTLTITRPAPAGPTLNVSPSTQASGFAYETGAGPSSKQTYTVTGTNLSTTITATLSNTDAYEMRTGENAYAAGPLTGLASGTAVDVRLKAGLSADDYASNLTFSSTGADSKVVALTGTVSDPKTATVTTISSAGITNLDIKSGTAAGILTATVTPDGASALASPTITWSSDDETIAKVGASTGVVTLVAVGTAHIKATYDGDETYSGSYDTYEIVVTDSRKSVTLSFSSASIVDYNYDGETLTAPTLTAKDQNDNTIDLSELPELSFAESHASGDATVTVDAETGVITGSNTFGTSTITVSFAGNANYKAATSKSYTVTRAPMLYQVKFDNGFEAFIEEGTKKVKVYYMAGTNAPSQTGTIKKASDYSAEVSGGNVILTKDTHTKTYEIVATAVTPFEGAGKQTFTAVPSYVASAYGYDSTKKLKYSKKANLDESKTDWTREAKGNSRLYFFVGAATNAVLTESNVAERNIEVYVNGVKDGTITKITKNGTITIALNNDNLNMIEIQSNQTSGDGGFKDITLTAPKKSVSVGANGYTTFACTSALDLTDANRPTGLKAYKGKRTGASITFEKLDQTVPAEEGLLLLGETKGGTYYIPVAASGTTVEDNDLIGVTSPVAKQSSTTGNYYFVMKKATNESDDLTFAPLSTESAVTIPAGKAYIEVPYGDLTGAHELTFTFEDASGDVTGIAEVSNKKVFNGDFYNLAGQKVAQPTKGLYIVNGKKVIIK